MRKKLIEVALPLDAINAAAAREKSIRHGHPSTLHLWWARRPLAAARAVIFSQMVDDPSEYIDVLLSDAGKKRAAQRVLKKRLAARASAAAAPAAPGNGNIGAGEKSAATVEVTYDHIRAQGKQEGLDARLMAIVAEGDRSRIYLAPTPQHEAIARAVPATWKPDMPLPDNPRDFKTPNYGLPTFGDLFTPRQLVALTTFTNLVGEATERVRHDAAAAGLPDDGQPLRDGGTGATAYAEAVSVYLGLGVSKLADAQTSLCRWKTTMDQSIATFGRQALPMVWDYSEANVFGGMAGDPLVSINNMMRVVDQLPASVDAHAKEHDGN